MSKEKFVRNKPHVNIGNFLKKKLGMAANEPEEPPIEPLDEADATDAEMSTGGWAKVSGLDRSVEAAEYRSGEEPPDPTWSKDGTSTLPLDSDEDGTSSVDPDVLGRVKVKFPALPDEEAGGPDEPSYEVRTSGDGEAEVKFGDGVHGRVPPGGESSAPSYQYGGGANEFAMDDTSGAEDGAAPSLVPMPYPNMASNDGPPDDAATVDKDETITIHGNRTEDAGLPGGNVVSGLKSNSSLGGSPDEADGGDKGLAAGEGEGPEVQHEQVYQHNETDLDFLNQRAGGAAGDDQPIIVGSVPNAEPPDAAEPFGDPIGNYNFKVEIDGADGADGSLAAAEAGDPSAADVRPHSAGHFALELDGGSEAGDSTPDESNIVGSVPNVEPEAFQPEPDDEVVVGFAQGDLNAPVIAGQLWNGNEILPEDDEASTLAGFKVGENLVGFDADDAPDPGDADLDDLDPDLDL